MKISGISRTPKLGEIGGESRLSEYARWSVCAYGCVCGGGLQMTSA